MPRTRALENPMVLLLQLPVTLNELTLKSTRYKRQLKCLQAVKDSGTAEPPDKNGNYPKDCSCRLGNLESYLKTVTKRLAGWEKANLEDPSTWPQDDL